MASISYSNGLTVPQAVIVIWEDNHCERAGYYRAYWADGPDATCGSPIVGYCSPGGPFRTIRQTAADAKRRYSGEPVYRNGKAI